MRSIRGRLLVRCLSENARIISPFSLLAGHVVTGEVSNQSACEQLFFLLAVFDSHGAGHHSDRAAVALFVVGSTRPAPEFAPQATLRKSAVHRRPLPGVVNNSADKYRGQIGRAVRPCTEATIL